MLKFACHLLLHQIAVCVTASYVRITPYPTVTATVNSALTVECTTTYSWSSISFFDEESGLGLAQVILLNNSGSCITLAPPLDGYSFSCDINNNLYTFTIENIKTEHNGKIIRCTVQYGPSSTDDISSADTTIVFGPAITTEERTTFENAVTTATHEQSDVTSEANKLTSEIVAIIISASILGFILILIFTFLCFKKCSRHHDSPNTHNNTQRINIPDLENVSEGRTLEHNISQDLRDICRVHVYQGNQEYMVTL